MRTLLEKIDFLISKYAEDGFVFIGGVPQVEIDLFIARCKFELKLVPPVQYTDILKKFDGVVVEGVFLYSTKPQLIPGSDGYSLDFIEMNLLSREVGGMEDFIFFGDSDQDVYVFDIRNDKYQVRDKQAFDNIYEEFEGFLDLFEYMVELMLARV